MAEDYNGWSNRPTWNANLWLSNDEGLYREINRLARFKDAQDEGDMAELGDLIEAFCEELWPDGVTPDGDVLALVDWEEIARAWVED